MSFARFVALIVLTGSAVLIGSACSSFSGSVPPDSEAGTPDATGDGPSTAAVDGGDAHVDADASAPPYAALILSDNPVGYWRLGEVQGAKTVDLTNKHPATDYGEPDELAGQPGAIVGDPDTAVLFENGYLRPQDPSGASTGAAFTLEAWIKPTFVDSVYTVMADNDRGSSSSTGWGYYFQLGGEYSIGVVLTPSDGNNALTSYANRSMRAGEFFHVVATYEGTTLKVYVNGLLMSTAIGARTLPSAHALTIGAQPDGTDPFKGIIDEVAIYDHVLPPAAVAHHYTVGSGKLP